jgi:heme/copper-type cytochrome/quinol oxidase subunit 3
MREMKTKILLFVFVLFLVSMADIGSTYFILNSVEESYESNNLLYTVQQSTSSTIGMLSIKIVVLMLAITLFFVSQRVDAKRYYNTLRYTILGCAIGTTFIVIHNIYVYYSYTKGVMINDGQILFSLFFLITICSFFYGAFKDQQKFIMRNESNKIT